YASSGQKKAGASTRSRRMTSAEAQQSSAKRSRICEITLENCSAPETEMSSSAPACSRLSPATGCGASSASASFTLCSLTVDGGRTQTSVSRQLRRSWRSHALAEEDSPRGVDHAQRLDRGEA